MQPALAVGDRLLVDKVRLAEPKQIYIVVINISWYLLSTPAVTGALRVPSSAGVK